MRWYEDLLARLIGAIPGEPDAVGGTVSLPFSATGYTAASDVAARLVRLTAAQDEAIALFPPVGEMTFCNEGLQHVARAVGCEDLNGLMADQELVRVSLLPDWREDTWARAVAHAQAGGLAFIGWNNPNGHGHVASVAPRPMQVSPSWGVPVPVLANVGEKNGYLLLSACFREALEHELRCFLWRAA